jgi:hypothetical protein
MQVVSSIESLWKNDTDNDIINNAAAVLSGDYGTGKTVCTCNILAKQRFATATTNTMGRKNGMQIVLCPIGSLVSLKFIVYLQCVYIIQSLIHHTQNLDRNNKASMEDGT